MAILGIDEVGRGPLAGPLVVGAVILPDEKLEWVEQVRDSKKLSAKKRELMSEIILKEALATGLGWVTAYEIDEMGIGDALRLATRRAVGMAQSKHVPFSQIVIDGKVNFLAGTRLGRFASVLPKADDLIKEVSAASIIAKVARDHYMVELAQEYPGYGFEKHMGYGTALHRQKMCELGLCPEHRRSFEPCKSMCGWSRSGSGNGSNGGSGAYDGGGARVGGSGARVGNYAGAGAGISAGVGLPTSVVKNTTLVGKQAEEKVAEYLTELGHTVVMRNFKTRFCEIDVVSVNDGKIYFTEVKYRANAERGGGLEAVTIQKQEQMKFAAEVFLKYYQQFRELDPLLAVAAVGGDFVVQDWFPLV